MALPFPFAVPAWGQCNGAAVARYHPCMSDKL